MSEEGSEYDRRESIFRNEDDEFARDGTEGEGKGKGNIHAGFFRKKDQIFKVLKDKSTPTSIINL